MTPIALHGSLSMGLVLAGSLCAACGSSASDTGGAGPTGSAGTSSAQAGSPGVGASASIGLGGAGGAGASNGSFAGTSTLGGAGGSFSNGGAGGGTSGTSGTSGGGMAGASGGSGGATSGTQNGKTEFAPYYEIGSSTSAFKNLVDLKVKSGVSDVTLAFVLAGSGCNADKTISGDLPDIKAFVAAGGHVKASFGGAAGKYLEANCADANALATAFGNFVDATGITDLDFDIEQGPNETATMNAMRGQALKIVQDSKHVRVSFTLQTDEQGLDKGARSVVQGAITAGVSVYHVNLMVMDYGDMPDGKAMAPIAIGSLEGANGQLKAMIPGLTTEQAYAMLGATPDIGQNDDNEIFTLQDAKDLAAYAKDKTLGLLSFWNIQRDQVCGKGECSQHDTANFDYAKIFEPLAQ